MNPLAKATATAEVLLGHSLPNRLKHVLATGQRAKVLTYLTPSESELVSVAGTLHDIGYSPDLTSANFHPLDGARFLRSENWDEDVINLVAHHSHAKCQARRLNLADDLESEFPFNPTLPHDEICFCDMSTGPTGELLTLDERITDIKLRHKEDKARLDIFAEAEGQIRDSYKRVAQRIS